MMPWLGSILPQSVVGIDPRDRAVDRAKERRRAVGGPAAQREEDEVEITAASGVEPGERLRSTKGNADEEAREDRTEHGFYTAHGQAGRGEEPRASVDVTG